MSISRLTFFIKGAFLPVSAILMLGACVAVEPAPTNQQAQSANSSPQDFTTQLRPRYLIGEQKIAYTLNDRMTHYSVPGVAIAIIKDGKIVEAKGYGVLQVGDDTKIDASTVFSIGSVSKVATAMIALKLHSQGLIDLDEDVSTYLKSWSLPDNSDFPDAKVTLRMILSHTSGLNLHGFGDFGPGEKLPTVIDTLNGAAPASHAPLKLLFQPGTGYKYSGGAYTLAQLILMDITGKSFEDLTKETLFTPLGMSRSTFENPLPEDYGNIAKAHDRDGTAVALPRGYEAMPEKAASGLWTSANDLGAMVVSLIQSYRTNTGYLPKGVATEMMTKVSPSQHGLGPRLEDTGDNFYFHHAGTNNSYRAWIEGHLSTGDGLVVLTNGAQGNDLFLEIRNGVADAMGWEINKPINIPAVKLGEDTLESYTGTYAVDAEFPKAMRQQMVGGFFEAPLEVRVENGNLVIGVTGNENSSVLTPTSPNRFMIADFPLRAGIAEIEFHRNAKGETHAMTFRANNALSHYKRK